MSLKSDLHFHLHIPSSCTKPPSCVKLVVSCGKNLKHPHPKLAVRVREQSPPNAPITLKHTTSGHSRFVIMAAVSLGVLVMLLSGVDEHKAWALGPEGPLVEEFWDNVRRYGIYALTVSTGALYTIFRPIFELLKNPISAILILSLFGGSIYIVSQVLSAMFGISDFSYDFGY
ncbi:hypothetical protein VNO77_06007 [Canavalia gladiata]|uniref:Uncharacterized protein ycf33 n=1 Tax=Canavalia gladiata TaxID=3824 RepID=A0AAN9N5X1_CANGL